MRERETASDPAEESGRRRVSIMVWMLAVVASFALGAVVTHFALLKEPLAEFSLQTFLTGPFWTTASIALVGFVLGIGFAYVPFSWYRADANRALRDEYRDLRSKAEALRDAEDAWDMRRTPQPSRTARTDEPQPEPPYAEDEEPPDIAAVISEMSAAIKANLSETGSARPTGASLRPSPLTKPYDE